jgi:hypothetical protein
LGIRPAHYDKSVYKSRSFEIHYGDSKLKLLGIRYMDVELNSDDIKALNYIVEHPEEFFEREV